MYNTERILTLLISDVTAASACNSYISGEYGDWHLPSLYELNLLYAKNAIVGGFANVDYWSSSEHTESSAYKQSFSTSTKKFAAKTSKCNIRLIRFF